MTLSQSHVVEDNKLKLTFENPVKIFRFWYPEMMSNDSHWVPTADDPLSCLTDPSLYDVKLMANCFVFQESVKFTHRQILKWN